MIVFWKDATVEAISADLAVVHGPVEQGYPVLGAGLGEHVADRLTISKRTVDNHVSNVFTKTGSKNRVALLNWAMDNGKICRDGFNCCVLPEHDPPSA